MPGINREFWAGKRVFLTGHTGFKGSWLSLWLQELGAELSGYALQAPTQPSLFELGHVASKMNSVTGDIRDIKKLSETLNITRPEIVIHMAAQPLVRYSYIEPVETYATNVMGTVNILEASRNTPSVRALVNVTTDKCYENREWIWGYRENDRLGGYDPYSSSKACSELISAAYRSSYFSAEPSNSPRLAIATARAGNIIGGGDWAKDRLVPDMISAFSEGSPAVIRNPQATRPWQHVLDALHGYLLLAEQLFLNGPQFSAAWNFGPNDQEPRTVAWIADAISKSWGGTATWLDDNQLGYHEAASLRLDATKARNTLGWESVLDLPKAIHLTVDWAKAYQSGRDMRDFTIQQIISYEEFISQ
jgi:CDP-glucose 4,6-dehydratase